MMRREGDRVLIDISRDEFDHLLMLLGYAYGHSRAECSALGRPFALTPRAIVHLTNVINEGNRQWTQSEIPPEGA